MTDGQIIRQVEAYIRKGDHNSYLFAMHFIENEERSGNAELAYKLRKMVDAAVFLPEPNGKGGMHLN